MRKILNAPEGFVADYLVGLADAHPDLLRVDRDLRLVLRADAPTAGQVAILSGGGAGHEPLHGGFVGQGMLHAACSGEVFTSPVPDQILAATRQVDGGRGVLYLVKNYTGDVMNFRLAAQEAAEEGIAVATVTIDDDVAVDVTDTAGRRGIGATLLAEKLAGAAAERGDDLQQVAALAQRVVDRSRSLGVALSSCTPPSAGKPLFELPDGQMEIGIGIHGEPGRSRQALASAAEIAELIVDAVVTDLRPAAGAQLLALLTGLGGTPESELYVLYGEIAQRLRSSALRDTRSLVGNYVTSLEMAGAALTILELDDELTALWDAPVRTSALRWGA